MVPADYTTFFMTMAGVGATLFGLIFVAISIAPEVETGASAALERQVKATTAYVALLNSPIISLFALVPHQQIGIAVLAFSGIGFINTFATIITLLLPSEQRSLRLRHSLFILAGLVLYGYEAAFGAQLVHTPQNVFTLFALSDLMIMISFFGVVRAWELIGVRQLKLKDLIFSLSISAFKRTAALKDPQVTADADPKEDRTQ